MLRFLIATVILMSSFIFAQAQTGDNFTLPLNKKPRKVGTISTRSDNFLNSKLENFKMALRNDPSSQGYIVIEGRKSEIAHIQKKVTRNLSLLKFDKSRISIVNVEKNEAFEIKLWLVPAGASTYDIFNEKPARDKDSDDDEDSDDDVPIAQPPA